ncbi:MAG: hypothetical protein AAF366_14760 [Pseudomonadota bacterium]
MRRLTVAFAIVAITVLAGATTVSVTAQTGMQQNTKFPQERMIEIHEAMGGAI